MSVSEPNRLLCIRLVSGVKRLDFKISSSQYTYAPLLTLAAHESAQAGYHLWTFNLIFEQPIYVGHRCPEILQFKLYNLKFFGGG